MAEPTVTLTTAQLHSIVGSIHEMGGKNAPLELATSTMVHAAEELRIVSRAAQNTNDEHDMANVLHAIAERLEAMGKLCDELGKGAVR
jgi:hypothetical protein